MVEEAVLKIVGCKRLGGSIPSHSAWMAYCLSIANVAQWRCGRFVVVRLQVRVLSLALATTRMTGISVAQ